MSRCALAKFRCGVAPLKIETGRYTRIPEEERLCTLCNLQEVESEEHCLIRCGLYPKKKTKSVPYCISYKP